MGLRLLTSSDYGLHITGKGRGICRAGQKYQVGGHVSLTEARLVFICDTSVVLLQSSSCLFFFFTIAAAISGKGIVKEGYCSAVLKLKKSFSFLSVLVLFQKLCSESPFSPLSSEELFVHFVLGRSEAHIHLTKCILFINDKIILCKTTAGFKINLHMQGVMNTVLLRCKTCFLSYSYFFPLHFS